MSNESELDRLESIFWMELSPPLRQKINSIIARKCQETNDLDIKEENTSKVIGIMNQIMRKLDEIE